MITAASFPPSADEMGRNEGDGDGAGIVELKLGDGDGDCDAWQATILQDNRAIAITRIDVFISK